METRFCEGQSSKGNNSKNIDARVPFLHSARRLMLIDILVFPLATFSMARRHSPFL